MNGLNITSVNVIPIKAQAGLVAFAEIELNDCLFCGNISIHTSPRHQFGFRCQFPTKRLQSGKQVNCFHPFTREAEETISRAIISEYLKIMENFQDVEDV